MLRRLRPRLCAAEPVERLVEEFDVLIVGGGPAGLAAAIRLKQLAGSNAENLRVGLIDKGSQIGAHTLSGACVEPRALEEFMPKYKEQPAFRTKVTSDSFYHLTKTGKIKSPYLPPMLHNDKNYIVSLGEVCKWLGEEAEALGVEIFPGFAAAEPVYGEGGHFEGVQLNDVGVNKKGEKTPQFEPGMILKGRQTLIAEGCRGSITKRVEQHFKLRESGNFQCYALGVKEVWEVPKEHFQSGRIIHTTGWPLTVGEGHGLNTYGGSFMYHYGENLMSVGYVVGLDYGNPFTRPYMELQKWKTHPFIREFFKDGKPLYYGARTLTEGGLTSMPKLTFPGGMLIGDCAGFLNLPKIKGTHTAMKSGLLAAESVWEEYFAKDPTSKPDYGKETSLFVKKFKSSWAYDELHLVRNVRQVFAMNFFAGVLYTGVTGMLTKGKEPFTLQHHQPDHKGLIPADKAPKIDYPKPDGVLTFDLLTNHARSGTTHNGDQPAHLKLKNPDVAKDVNWKLYQGPEGKYCPAGVYEWVDKDGKKELIINAQNCVHCKACDIKDPTQNINWCVPEGGGGPGYNAQM
jgi:electron-transferring-flavoprotein dehydrogenase